MWGKVSCLRKQHDCRDWASNRRPSDLKPNALTTTPPRMCINMESKQQLSSASSSKVPTMKGEGRGERNVPVSGFQCLPKNFWRWLSSPKVFWPLSGTQNFSLSSHGGDKLNIAYCSLTQQVLSFNYSTTLHINQVQPTIPWFALTKG